VGTNQFNASTCVEGIGENTAELLKILRTGGPQNYCFLKCKGDQYEISSKTGKGFSRFLN
jgi:hypothetical protein